MANVKSANLDNFGFEKWKFLILIIKNLKNEKYI